MGLGASSVASPTAEDRVLLQETFISRCGAVADSLCTADVLLLCTGAGFSADSGLAIYRDIADIDVYREAGLDYSNICRPVWLDKDPELFYGFWGACYNDYRETQPHEGYDIVQRWRNTRFRDSVVSRRIQEQLQQGVASPERPVDQTEPYRANGSPGAFFVFTSNVDAHSFDYFASSEVRECHGNTEVWQCGRRDGPCCPRTWRAPKEFSFAVDKTSMRAARLHSHSSSSASNAAEDGSHPTVPQRLPESSEAELSEVDKETQDAVDALKNTAAACARWDSLLCDEPAAAIESCGIAPEGDAAGEPSDAIANAVVTCSPSFAVRGHAARQPSDATATTVDDCSPSDGTALEGDATIEQCHATAVDDGTPSAEQSAAASRVGQVQRPFGQRKVPLANLPSAVDLSCEGFCAGENWPRCIYCKSLARPAILMFGDTDWIDNEGQDARWEAWLTAVGNAALERSQQGGCLRTVIVEIGCGDNVRTGRTNTEMIAEQLAANQGSVDVVRINRDLPFADSPPKSSRHRHISILSSGLEALRQIDKEWVAIHSTNTSSSTRDYALASGEQYGTSDMSTPETPPPGEAVDSPESRHSPESLKGRLNEGSFENALSNLGVAWVDAQMRRCGATVAHDAIEDSGVIAPPHGELDDPTGFVDDAVGAAESTVGSPADVESGAVNALDESSCRQAKRQRCDLISS